jgi:vesicle transport through interaction with t-SNAREs protein 1
VSLSVHFAEMADALVEQNMMNIEMRIIQVRKDLQQLDVSGSTRWQDIESQIDRELADIDHLLTNVNLEVQRTSPQQREYFRSQLAMSRSELGKATAELRTKRSARRSGYASGQSEKLHANLQKTDQIMDDLDQTIAVGNDAKAIGEHALSLLAGDSERIKEIDKNLTVISEGAEEGQSRLKSMANRALMHRVFVWLIVLLLVILMGLAVYLKFFVFRQSGTPSAPVQQSSTPAEAS